MDTGKVAIAIVAAAATGAILGLLFAPAKGKVLRRKIRSVGAREVEDMKDKYYEFAENVSKSYDKVKEDLSDFAKKTIKQEEEMLKTAKDLVK